MGILYSVDDLGGLRPALSYLRKHGLKRFLYRVHHWKLLPLLEPVRRLMGRFLMLPAKQKGLILVLIAVVGLGLTAMTSPWYALPLFLLMLYLGYKYAHTKLRAALHRRHWRKQKDDLMRASEQGYVLAVEHLGLQEEMLKALQKELERSPEVVIADIDQDGFLLSRFGPIPDAPTVDRESFLKRKRRHLEVVAKGQKVGVKKYYRGNRAYFLNELDVLNSMVGHCNVPAILDVDFNSLTITMSYIPGTVIREMLAERGAMLRNRDLDGHSDFMHLSREERNLARIEQGRRVLQDSVEQELVNDIFAQLRKIHRIGICIGDMKYGNIILERNSRKPYFIDFEHSRDYGRSRGLWWEVARDHEIERFNFHFGTGKLTRDSVLRRIDALSSNSTAHWHTPIDFGRGVASGGIWDTESGEGRWHCMLKPNLPNLSGKRVLDLGCGDAYFSLQMLRQGAREVVGIEPRDPWIERAQFVKEAFEWADSKTYNLKLVHTSIEELPTSHLGGFDLVTALHDLQHMSDALIDQTVRHVGTLTDCFVIQCNLDSKESCPGDHLQASADQNARVLERNGFDLSYAVTHPGYRWLLLIGTRS